MKFYNSVSGQWIEVTKDAGFPVAIEGAGLVAPFRFLTSAASTNATVVKASEGRLFKVFGLNSQSLVRYLKIYNKATSPTVGTDVPVITIALKGSDFFDVNLNPYGQIFSNGISFAITANVADNDATAIASGNIVGLNFWYL